MTYENLAVSVILEFPCKECGIENCSDEVCRIRYFFFGKKEVEVVRILSSSSYHRKTTWFSLYRVFICHLIA